MTGIVGIVIIINNINMLSIVSTLSINISDCVMISARDTSASKKTLKLTHTNYLCIAAKIMREIFNNLCLFCLSANVPPFPHSTVSCSCGKGEFYTV